MIYTIYTDGSDLKHTSKRLGIGGILVNTKNNFNFMYGEKIGEFSEELDRSLIKSEYNTDDCSNPFAEMIAAYYALTKFSGKFKSGDRVIIKADYSGVEAFCTGKWKAKLPYIQKVKNQILNIVNNAPFITEFAWIRGHQSIMDTDTYWNNEVDKLAKGL